MARSQQVCTKQVYSNAVFIYSLYKLGEQTVYKTGKIFLYCSFLIIHFSFSIVSAQDCDDAIVETTPTEDFSIHGDGTVTHYNTGLMWKVCSEGQTWNAGACDGTITVHNWQQALQIPEVLNAVAGFAGYTDWRVPNIKELSTIVERKCQNPSINSTAFPSTPTTTMSYLSSSPYFGGVHSVWHVQFDRGDAYYSDRTFPQYIRLVRSVQ